MRYQFATGNNDGLLLQNRYERKVQSSTSDLRGDRYHAIYSGINYFIYGHKLKLMSGLEYASMNDRQGNGGDFNGWTFFAGLRMYF